ncbi:hypothetical protein HRF69_10925 [Bacillus circulans]|uniref:hypothetical protein n=1 Tax=Niallia circulans TaxID=1397 RepID=UPI00155FA442|nr:hypothetical protein [Niallia circulans]NRG27627.1 hypothetical protein [Niallia circulans]
MDKHIKEYKAFLEDELKRSKEHSRILDEIDIKLHEMKAIAEYAVNNELNKEEINRMNAQLLTLKEEIADLERGLNYTVH